MVTSVIEGQHTAAALGSPAATGVRSPPDGTPTGSGIATAFRGTAGQIGTAPRRRCPGSTSAVHSKGVLHRTISALATTFLLSYGS